jgi:AcrR family transcriptional regulator
MAADQEIKLRILALMRDRMLLAGYSKVTLDELADELGISKKTLYKFFPSKDELAMEAIRFQFHEIEQEINAIHASGGSFTDKLQRIILMMRERVSKISPMAMQDIRKHAPQLWKEIETLRREHILKKLETMIFHAREEGVLRPDVDERMLVRILLASVEAVANPETLSVLSIPMHEVLDSIYHIIFEGALTDQARTELQNFRPVPRPHPHGRE